MVIEDIDHSQLWNIEGLMMPMWTIFDHPLDHPDGFIIRLFDADQPTDQAYTAISLDVARTLVPHGTVVIARHDEDHPSVVECWI
jgi:hypothetical protein